MAVVSCPKCPTKLKVPDGAAGNVKCPKCGTIFPASPVASAFEVVDEPATRPAAAKPATAAPARPAAAPPPPPPPPAPAAEKAEKAEKKDDFDFGEVVQVKKKRSDDDDDDDDDRDRKKKRRSDDDDEDDSDRGRSKRRRDDDDDDDDRRDRKKKRRRDRDRDDDDDEDDDDWRPAKKGSGVGHASVGMLLVNISFWLYMASLALISLIIFLGWVGAFDSSPTPSRGGRGGYTESSSGGGMEILVKLPGFIGLGNWIVAMVGFGFCIAGPARARGLAITAMSLSAAHFILMMITFNNIGGGSGYIPVGDVLNWPMVATTLLGVDALIPILVTESRMVGMNVILFFLAGVCELLRLIFAMVMVKELANSSKAYDGAEKAGFATVAACIIVGVTAIVWLLVAILGRSGAISSTGGGNLVIGIILLTYLAFTAITVLPLIATNLTRLALARKARRR